MSEDGKGEDVDEKDHVALEMTSLNTTPETKFDWSENDFIMLRTTYERLSVNSARLLETAKTCKHKESVLQYLIVLLGLSSSFVSALPGINETARAYVTSAFTLLTALIGGWMSKKEYGRKSGKFYSAYQEYKDLLTLIDNIMVTLKSDRDYESFNYLVSKVESKYEIFLPIDVIDEKKIKDECAYKFTNLNRRFADMEKEKTKTRYKQFMDRKSYIYLHECKLSLYRQYVFSEKFLKKSVKVFGCYEYEDWCRIHFPEKYQEYTRVYDKYVKSQTARFYLPNGDFDAEKINNELATRRVMSLSERDFSRTIHDRFITLQNRIRDQEYTEHDQAQRSDENYSLDFME